MINKPLTLSIVIPAYNEQNYLEACLTSIAQQTLMPLEVLVVDNNSTDDTIKLAKHFSFVRVLKETKQGVFYAAQKGFRASKGTIIGRIDADTILPEDWVENIIQMFSEPEVSAVTGPVSYYDMPLPHSNHWFDHSMRKLTYRLAYNNCPFLYGSNLAVRCTKFRQVSSQLCTDQDIHEDIDLAIHLREAGGEIIYSKVLLSGASGRRYNDGFKSFSSYIGMYKRTYSRHKMHSLAIYPAMFMWSLGYVLMHPWRNVWYSLYGWLNSFYPVSREARKNPMSS